MIGNHEPKEFEAIGLTLILSLLLLYRSLDFFGII